MKCICREIKLNIDSILFLIVKKRKVDDVDDLEPSTSTGLPMKVQSNYMHHLSWFYIIGYRCGRLYAHLLFVSLYFLMIVVEKDVTCRYCSAFKPVYLDDKVSAPNAVNVVSVRNASVVVRLTTTPQKMQTSATSACCRRPILDRRCRIFSRSNRCT